MNDNATDGNKQPEQQQPASQSQPVKRKFEIAVYNEDLQDDGSIALKPVAMTEPLIIEASSKDEFNELIKIYKDCGQQVKIIREIDPPSPQTPPQHKKLKIKAPQQNQAIDQQEKIERRKPVVFRVGDIEVKEDNGTIYQKQWMRLTDKEAANFRIVNTANNKLVSLNGKHIEMKRWVKVEKSEDESTIEGELENGT